MGRRVMLTFAGQTRSQTDWARHLGMDPRTLNARLTQGWPLAQALSAVVGHQASQPRPCRWCPEHEQAWLEPMEGPPTWHPLPRGMLWLALRIARGSGCAEQIEVVLTACDRCLAEAVEEKHDGP